MTTKSHKFLDEEKFERGRLFYEQGLNAFGQRHAALLDVSYYLFFSGYGHEEERHYLLVKWISKKHNDYSKDWLRSQKGVKKDIESMVKWKSSGVFPKAQISHPFHDYNNIRTEGCRERLTVATRQLFEQGRLHKQNGRLNLSVVARQAQVNSRTASRHKSLIEEEIKKLANNSQISAEKTQPKSISPILSQQTTEANPPPRRKAFCREVEIYNYDELFNKLIQLI